jgi:hypothetical protein
VLQLVRRKLEPYQPMSSSEWKSSVILGMALAMMVLSYGILQHWLMETQGQKGRLSQVQQEI